MKFITSVPSEEGIMFTQIAVGNNDANAQKQKPTSEAI